MEALNETIETTRKGSFMNRSSGIPQQIIARTELREIDATHYAGRHNDFFISMDIQSRLSRIASSISVYQFSEKQFQMLNNYVNSKYGSDFSTLVFEINEITIFTPMKKNYLAIFIDFINDVTAFLSSQGALADPELGNNTMNIQESFISEDTDLPKRNYTAWGFLGSFLGSIPGVMAWFIITILQHNARIVQSPDLVHIISLGFFMAIIITCGSYWGFLLLSEGYRTRSFFLSLPFTIFMILFINCISQAFLFYATIPGISFVQAFAQTPQLVFEYLLSARVGMRHSVLHRVSELG